MSDPLSTLKSLFLSHMGREADSIEPLPASASNRRYYRLSGGGTTLIGVIGTSVEENRAFTTIARHFRDKGLRVPGVVAESEDGTAYLQEDLGGTVLFDKVAPGRESGRYSQEELALLKDTLAYLPRIQYLGGEGMDWSVCYPQESFDARMVDFDLNYFKYCFLKPAGVEFNENLLQNDFELFKEDLLEDSGETFLYRDFQARNIMIRDGQPWFIDFQGGRKGPIYYDVASFVWQARSRFSPQLKDELIDCYLEALRPFRKMDGETFRRQLKPFVLLRTLQVLGAYGFRGYVERKSAFLGSIPFALQNLREILQKPLTQYPYLDQILHELCERGATQGVFSASQTQQNDGVSPLQVTVYSFSYKKGIPEDTSGNGGGYVFDCRALHNPGRYAPYKSLCGTDEPVIRFLEEHGETAAFLESVYRLVDAHVQRYLERGFSHLQLCFGCTGGQHRSVYCAQHTAEHIAEKFKVKVVLRHREQQREQIL